MSTWGRAPGAGAVLVLLTAGEHNRQKREHLHAFMWAVSCNVWRHMTITKYYNEWKFYLDGSLKATRSESLTVGSSWMLGNYGRVNGNGNSNNHYFRGKFDEIAVWHRTLSAAEVTKVYETSYFGTPLL